MPDLSIEEARAKLKEQFAKFGGDKYGEGWADLVSIATFKLTWESAARFSALPHPDFEEVEQRRLLAMGSRLS
jgi:hypothetical protein